MSSVDDWWPQGTRQITQCQHTAMCQDTLHSLTQFSRIHDQLLANSIVRFAVQQIHNTSHTWSLITTQCTAPHYNVSTRKATTNSVAMKTHSSAQITYAASSTVLCYKIVKLTYLRIQDKWHSLAECRCFGAKPDIWSWCLTLLLFQWQCHQVASTLTATHQLCSYECST